MLEKMGGVFFGMYTWETILYWIGTFESLERDLKILINNEVICGHIL